MAKEVDLKKIELKVSVICCDGCKRKVRKVLQGVEGVLKTEIDPFHPKVTVLGNVDPQILIRRLSKAGKQTELWSHGNPTSRKEQKEADTNTPLSSKEKDKSKPECEQAKSSASNMGDTSNKIKETKNDGDGNETTKVPKEDQQKETGSCKNVNSSGGQPSKEEVPPHSHPQVIENTTTLHHQEVNNFGACNYQYSYKVEPYAIAVPYYAIPSYAAPASLPPMGYGYGYLLQERPLSQPALAAPAVRVGDYFSDENTVGCSVM
ncbi:hypothetical protein Tsubulata_033495 [Turnera subulata]|uniref:HMA domain-containing protein n=1 Tax=Turnera subulata TaxID=218843 RepID=A0A9Q0F9A8_9ROSI|nr:hypothetical protein Tsubulata_033495 [Turnera subulata]